MSKGWHGDSLRHMNARVLGKAGPMYKGRAGKPRSNIERIKRHKRLYGNTPPKKRRGLGQGGRYVRIRAKDVGKPGKHYVRIGIRRTKGPRGGRTEKIGKMRKYKTKKISKDMWKYRGFDIERDMRFKSETPRYVISKWVNGKNVTSRRLFTRKSSAKRYIDKNYNKLKKVLR